MVAPAPPPQGSSAGLETKKIPHARQLRRSPPAAVRIDSSSSPRAGLSASGSGRIPRGEGTGKRSGPVREAPSHAFRIRPNGSNIVGLARRARRGARYIVLGHVRSGGPKQGVSQSCIRGSREDCAVVAQGGSRRRHLPLSPRGAGYCAARPSVKRAGVRRGCAQRCTIWSGGIACSSSWGANSSEYSDGDGRE
jgi:hypothetical protein